MECDWYLVAVAASADGSAADRDGNPRAHACRCMGARCWAGSAAASGLVGRAQWLKGHVAAQWCVYLHGCGVDAAGAPQHQSWVSLSCVFGAASRLHGVGVFEAAVVGLKRAFDADLLRFFRYAGNQQRGHGQPCFA